MSTLALVMIVKNEEKNLERCLSSVSPIVDEMIVLDTGSTDATVEIAKRLGARVHHFQWRDDFSAARNAALDLSWSDWKLVLDADEWLVSGHDELRCLGNEPFIGQVALTSFFRNAGVDAESTNWISRLLPKGVRYTGRIHEQPNGAGLACRRVGVCIEHDGYMPQRLAAKAGRNDALLRKALEASPNDGYLLYQLGKDLSIYDKYRESADYFVKALAVSELADPYRHDLIVRTMFTLKMANRHEDAIALASSEFDRWPQSPDFFFCVGDVLLDWAVLNPGQAEQLLPIVETSWLKCLQIGEQPDLSGAVAGRGSFLAAQNLAVLYENTGRSQEAARYIELASMAGRAVRS
ncbi:glycosyltransferase family 2 protein [Candidimonas sp. SYP-B2681]|uniref:glycosyltransferase family 2 protein n=1 Tax=Candidimonas sp. SYP-B2681 TaxID=2497686 RepID=UPI000F88041F|nr:glycosyltransferase family 2 protein [Candidimonas sp. SYP-B2681]RTZ47574.1 glycosyltransferase family 2 protein [Candidimonas sp. SYP-B2681]